MNDTTILSTLSLPQKALAVDLDALYVCLQTIPDQRYRRGLQYPLASLLMIGVLAKLAGQDSSRALAHGAKLHTRELSQLFQLKREKMPHYSTWSRVLGHGVEPAEVERGIGQFFASATKGTERNRGSIQLALDGKNLAGNDPARRKQGSASAGRLPTSTRHRARSDACRGEKQGDYLWTVKDNQEGLREDIEVLFQPHRKRAGTSAPPNDFRTTHTVEKGHGRLEKRTITVSSMLADYSTWPGLAQVFKLESLRTDALGTTKLEVRYGVTSLPAYLVDPKRLLQLTRGHWGIENKLHYRRDATLREDHAQLRMGHAPQMLAVLNNTVLGLLARHWETNVAHARREFAYHFDKALAALMA